MAEPIGLYTKTDPKRIKCFKIYECFHIYAETECQTKTMHKLDIIFTVSAAKFQQITTGLHSIIVITPAHTQPRALYKI